MTKGLLNGNDVLLSLSALCQLLLIDCGARVDSLSCWRGRSRPGKAEGPSIRNPSLRIEARSSRTSTKHKYVSSKQCSTDRIRCTEYSDCGAVMDRDGMKR